jgi:hypothetical protein
MLWYICTRTQQGWVASPSNSYLTALLVSPVAFLQHNLPACLAMASFCHVTVSTLSSPPQYQSVIVEKHGELVILVPEGLHKYSAELFELHKKTFGNGASDKVVDLQCDTFVGTVPEDQKSTIAFFHYNIPDIRRDLLYDRYPGYIPLSLLERGGWVIAGVMGCSVSTIFLNCMLGNFGSSGLQKDYRPVFERYSEDYSTRERC